jgi:TIR domain-containing protein
LVYEYRFDERRYGDIRLSRKSYEIVQLGLALLRDELENWNSRVSEGGGAYPPFEHEVADLNRLIDWGESELESGTPEIVVRGASVGNGRYIKAALVFAIGKQQDDCRQKAQQAGWPETALRSIRDAIERIKSVADIIDCEPSDVLAEVLPRRGREVKPGAWENMEWDAFICHASEDKEVFVRPLAKALMEKGLNVWFDEFALSIGDSLRRSIDRGLARSRFGVVVISPDFLQKEWPQKELDGLVAREVDGVKVILPVWHDIGAAEIRAISPTLADRVAASSNRGVDYVVEQLVSVIRQDRRAVTAETPESRIRDAAANREVVDLWVNTEYAAKLGLIEKLRAESYDLKWEAANDEASSIDLEGWEYVIVERKDGSQCRLKIKDAPVVGGYVVLLKRTKR